VKYRHFFQVFSVIQILTVLPASAEWFCASEISYKWVKAPVAIDPAQTASPSPAAASEPTTVNFERIERSGSDQTAAKENLEVEVGRVKAQASDACRREHEAFGGCVAVKLAAHTSLLQALGFSARGELERALTSECRNQQGSCLSVVNTEAKCKEKVVAAASPVATEGDKKGEGKKKK